MIRISEVRYIETPYGPEAECSVCSGELEWIECTQCDEYGMSYHDCGEDVCCCLDDSPNVECDICYGRTGWYWCNSCDKISKFKVRK